MASLTIITGVAPVTGKFRTRETVSIASLPSAWTTTRSTPLEVFSSGSSS